jgi:ketol-acid reductoisomerase
MRDNGFNVIIGQDKRFKGDWNRAVKDGFKPGKPSLTSRKPARRPPSS